MVATTTSTAKAPFKNGVYLLLTRNGGPFKVGLTGCVWARTAAVVENPAQFLADESVAAYFPTRALASRIEKLLHTHLTEHRLRSGPFGDKHSGSSEWFHPAVFPQARAFLAHQAAFFQRALEPITIASLFQQDQLTNLGISFRTNKEDEERIRKLTLFLCSHGRSLSLSPAVRVAIRLVPQNNTFLAHYDLLAKLGVDGKRFDIKTIPSEIPTMQGIREFLIMKGRKDYLSTIVRTALAVVPLDDNFLKTSDHMKLHDNRRWA
jgi:hypothetical protein